MLTWEEGLSSQAEFLYKITQFVNTVNCTVNTNKNIEYYNIPAAFDIETSSFYLNGEKRACMYIWQFGIYSWVTSGRTWDEFIHFIDLLKLALGICPQLKLLVYVHNLPYEFQWIRKHFEWDKVFLLDDRKPVYCDYGGLEFRCSLKLAGGRSLDAVAKDLQKYKVRKLVGNLDYQLIRTPLTPLSEKELKYCENDIRVILSYIMEKIEQDGDITKIPLTNTGYVRQYCRKACYKSWKRYRSLMNQLTITPDEYSQLKRAFQGGFTHASVIKVDKIISQVGSHDLRSSYPAAMVLERFPMSKAILVEGELSQEEIETLFLTKACLFDIEIWGLYPKIHYEHILSKSKCSIVEGYVVDNGRLSFSEHIKTTMTEQDYFSLSRFYEWDRIAISNLRVYEKEYLPKPFVESILTLFEDKTKLKGVSGEELNYMISKNMINAAYGMIVTDPVRDEIVYSDDEFHSTKADISEAIERYNKNIRRFLFYPWGVWVTAYARANLMSSIVAMGEDYIYSDTDSNKCLNPGNHEDYFITYNSQVKDKIIRSSQHFHIPIERYMPKTIKGKEQIIGTWADEGIYSSFKTLGAKRYLVSKHHVEKPFDDNELTVELEWEEFELTVAGVSKRKAMAFLKGTGKPFEAFTTGLVVPEEYSGRLLSTYIDEETEGDIVDYTGRPYHFHELSSIHMEPTDYSLDRAEEFTDYLKGVVDISE